MDMMEIRHLRTGSSSWSNTVEVCLTHIKYLFCTFQEQF